MSILINGMEMPTGERPVHIEIHRDGTVLQWKFNESDEIVGTAVEVPPHGRLIDAGKMRESIRKQTAFLRLIGGKFAEIAETLEKGFLQELDNAPTIIPASKDGE